MVLNVNRNFTLVLSFMICYCNVKFSGLFQKIFFQQCLQFDRLLFDCINFIIEYVDFK
jgi:hypothetical protein